MEIRIHNEKNVANMFEVAQFDARKLALESDIAESEAASQELQNYLETAAEEQAIAHAAAVERIKKELKENQSAVLIRQIE